MDLLELGAESDTSETCMIEVRLLGQNHVGCMQAGESLGGELHAISWSMAGPDGLRNRYNIISAHYRYKGARNESIKKGLVLFIVICNHQILLELHLLLQRSLDDRFASIDRYSILDEVQPDSLLYL